MLTYLPDNADEKPPQQAGTAPAKSPEGIDAVVPQRPNESYDMTDVIERLVDDGSILELRPEYGGEILTAFARIDGRPIGIVANQPAQRAGAIFPDAAEKAAQFIWTADAFNVPLLYLCDTPGFMAGSQVEKDGILEQGKKLIYATSAATVPQQTVVVRKAYGAGIYAMGGPAYDPESVIGLPPEKSRLWVRKRRSTPSTLANSLKSTTPKSEPNANRNSVRSTAKISTSTEWPAKLSSTNSSRRVDSAMSSLLVLRSTKTSRNPFLTKSTGRCCSLERSTIQPV